MLRESEMKRSEPTLSEWCFSTQTREIEFIVQQFPQSMIIYLTHLIYLALTSYNGLQSWILNNEEKSVSNERFAEEI